MIAGDLIHDSRYGSIFLLIEKHFNHALNDNVCCFVIKLALSEQPLRKMYYRERDAQSRITDGLWVIDQSV